ncbi:MAG: N-acetylmuramoyl-L-alanine amidase [Alphaproteobacteria bacterium]|nr:N-acetylmuramoyl-L-alanine amidase [Alphaproteobacteria bacterium]
MEPRQGGLKPTILLMHYTGMESCEKAIDWLSRPESKVSCHYVIDTDGTIIQMVGERMRAWHAGVASWRGERDVNSASIGIEIHNPGHGKDYRDFPDRQMQAVSALSKEIIARWGIAPERVLGHSDVAPGRKIDPGERFDWAGLAAAGIGRWVEPEPLGPLIESHSRQPGAGDVAHVQRLLASYGYGVAVDGVWGEACRTVLSAFQLHFRPQHFDGVIDASTVATLERLIDASDLGVTS